MLCVGNRRRIFRQPTTKLVGLQINLDSRTSRGYLELKKILMGILHEFGRGPRQAVRLNTRLHIWQQYHALVNMKDLNKINHTFPIV